MKGKYFQLNKQFSKTRSTAKSLPTPPNFSLLHPGSGRGGGDSREVDKGLTGGCGDSKQVDIEEGAERVVRKMTTSQKKGRG